MGTPVRPETLSPEIQDFLSPRRTDKLLSSVTEKLRIETPGSGSPERTSKRRRSNPSSPRPTKHHKMTEDVNMAQNDTQPDTIDYTHHIIGAKSYNPPAKGWTAALVRENHTDEVVARINEKTLAAVILSSDFVDRDSAPAAIKSILCERGTFDVTNVDVLRATPKNASVDGVQGLGMPWTHMIVGGSNHFYTAALANPIFFGSYFGRPVTFYVIPALPETPFIILVFTGIAENTPHDDIRDALLDNLLGDPKARELVSVQATNISNSPSPEFTLKVMFSVCQVGKCYVRRRGVGRQTVTVPAFRIIVAPFSKEPEINVNFQRHVMSPAFSFTVPLRGVGKPWLGSNPSAPKLIGCAECHGADHYVEDCFISNTPEYKTTHGINVTDSTDAMDVATSLSFNPAAPATSNNQWTTVSYRGGRGGPRGGRGGFAPYGRGRGGFFDSGRGGYGGFRGGYRGGYGY